jgi:diadenosine tetraphosphate (Ap4A) HIT family hydrolase
VSGGCLGCEADPPGGVILDTDHWRVEHTIGSLGVGTLIVKPRRHVLHVGDLDDVEAEELGPLLRDVSRVAQELSGADQVYVCLWSHAGGVPGHIHFVVQPVRAGTVPHGPWLQVALFERGEPPAADAAADVAERARRLLAPR